MSATRRYLLHFAQEHVDFRFPEIESLAALFKIPLKFAEKPAPSQPFWIVELPSDSEVKVLASRSVALRSCVELWCEGRSNDELHTSLKRLSLKPYERWFREGVNFKFEVHSYCKHLNQTVKVERIQDFSYLPFKGAVNLKNPDVTFHYFEYYGTEARDPPSEPHRVFFGRLVTDGFRQFIKQLSLKTRKFIGNTSMDPQLSILMANQARVKDGDLVLDPFVGSGSLLVSAAYFGAFVWGTDIDYLMLHGKTRPSRITQRVREADESIKANLKQYNLEMRYLDVMVNDFSIPFWKENLRFDSIITDPPYGIREATEKIGINKENYTISEEHLSTHIPAKIEYGISAMFADLLDFAARHLRVGGRLVCWFPVYREDYDEKHLPSHPVLQLVANSEQTLSKFTARRLLTFEKIAEASAHAPNERTIHDFRRKYFEMREETRKQRRTREASVRALHRLEALRKMDKT